MNPRFHRWVVRLSRTRAENFEYCYFSGVTYGGKIAKCSTVTDVMKAAGFVTKAVAVMMADALNKTGGEWHADVMEALGCALHDGCITQSQYDLYIHY